MNGQQQPEFDSNVKPATMRSGSLGGPSQASSKSTVASVASNSLRELTKEERFIVQETMDEYRRKGFFKRIFPAVDFLYYKQFFEEDRPFNRLLDERIWAKKRDVTH